MTSVEDVQLTASDPERTRTYVIGVPSYRNSLEVFGMKGIDGY